MAQRAVHITPRVWWGLVALILISIGGGLMIRFAGAPPRSNDKVIILGIDGMDPNLLEEYMAKGNLPHFARLRERGLYSRLGTTIPPESPVAWSTFATGCNPGKHGLFDFVKRAPGSYLPDLTLAQIEGSQYVSPRQGEPFWSLTSARHIATTILRCPVTFPPEAVQGHMLSGMGVPDLRGSQGTFSYWTTESLQKPQAMGGRSIQLNKNEAELKTVLYGPTFGQGSKQTELTTPLSITLDQQRRNVTLELQGRKHTLREGEWSPWFRVKFKMGFFQSVSAICRFYLKSVSPELMLYGSPLNFDPENPPYAISHPKRYARDLAAAIGLYHTQGMPEDTWALNEGRISDETFLEQCDQIHHEREAMLWYELNKFHSGILVIVFDTVDRVQHMFWRAIDRAHPLYTAELNQQYGHVIESWYRRMDDLVGRVLEKIDDDTTMVVLSDHGFSSFRRAVHLNSWLRDQGFLVLTENHKEARGYGQGIDWARTKAYAIGIGGVFLNMRGREPQGIVEPGKQASELKAAIATQLLTLVDPATGQRVVRRALAREEVYSGPETEHAPDLFVGFFEGYRASWQTAVGGVPLDLFEDNTKKWSGDHIVDPALVPGILLVNRPLSLHDPQLADVAPTILKLVGTEIPPAMDGKALW